MLATGGLQMRWLASIRLDNLRGDIYGGLTAAVVALPLALAFGVSSGAGPVAGLYGAIIVGFFAALFGGTPAQVSGPTGPMTVVTAMVVGHYTGLYPDDPSTGLALAFTVVMLGGLVQVGMGLARVGQYINYVPQPVISGFMTGIGVIIILLQLAPLLGHEAPSAPLAAARSLPEVLLAPVPEAAGFGVLTLLVVFLWPNRLQRVLPSPLLALVVVTLATMWFASPRLTTLGEIPTGLPRFQPPAFDLHLLPGMLKSAVVLAMLGSIDSLLTSLVADNITRTHHDPDRELVGQGIGNTLAGLFGGLPGAGATMRTVVNVRAGGRTPLSGALHALVLLAIVLGLGGLAAHIPHVVLAGILIKVGIDIVDWDYLRRLHRVPRAGMVMMLTVLVTTVFVDLITAVAVGMVMASFVFMKRMTDLQVQGMAALVSPEDSAEAPLTEEERDLLRRAGGRVLLFHLSGPLSFSSAKAMVRRQAQVTGYQVMLLDLTEVPAIDYTTARAIEDILHDCIAAGRTPYLVGMRAPVRDMLQRLGVLDAIDAAHVLDRRGEALRRALDELD